jgi:thioredoxin-related protein
MKKILVFLSLILVQCVAPSFAQQHNDKKDGLVWTTDLMVAQERSQATKKPIFAFFTGSDWCGWCHKLQRDVFVKPAFIKWAQKEVVLLELDFPRQKQLSPELQQQNNSLQQTFQVRGYPTIWMFYMDGDKATGKMNITPLGSTGYPSGAEPGKEEVKFLNEVNGFIAKAKSTATAK